MYEIALHPMVHGAVLIIVAYLAAAWWYKRDEKVEDRRREAIKLIPQLKTAGHEWMADFVTDYAVGDYDEIGVKVLKLIQLSKNDVAMKAELRKMALAVLMGGLEDEETRNQIAAALEVHGRKVGDTPEPAHVPFIDPKVTAFLKMASEVLENAKKAPAAAKSAVELAAAGVSVTA